LLEREQKGNVGELRARSQLRAQGVWGGILPARDDDTVEHYLQ